MPLDCISPKRTKGLSGQSAGFPDVANENTSAMAASGHQRGFRAPAKPAGEAPASRRRAAQHRHPSSRRAYRVLPDRPTVGLGASVSQPTMPMPCLVPSPHMMTAGGRIAPPVLHQSAASELLRLPCACPPGDRSAHVLSSSVDGRGLQDRGYFSAMSIMLSLPRARWPCTLGRSVIKMRRTIMAGRMAVPCRSLNLGVPRHEAGVLECRRICRRRRCKS